MLLLLADGGGGVQAMGVQGVAVERLAGGGLLVAAGVLVELVDGLGAVVLRLLGGQVLLVVGRALEAVVAGHALGGAQTLGLVEALHPEAGGGAGDALRRGS